MANHLWKPGQSGNASGRTKEMVQALRRERAEFLAVFHDLHKLMINQALGLGNIDGRQAWAIDKLFDRHMGKVSQSIDIDQIDNDGDDASAIPNMSHQEIQMFKNMMVMELVYSLDEGGKEDSRLHKMIAIIRGGWRPDCVNDEMVVIEQASVKKGKKEKQLTIEGKVVG